MTGFSKAKYIYF